MLRDHEQRLWVGASDGIVGLKEEGGAWRAAITGLASQRVTRLHQDPQGNIWIGTYQGLYRYANGGFVSHADVLHSVPTEYIGAIASDHVVGGH